MELNELRKFSSLLYGDDEDIQEHFEVDSIDKADWCIGKIGQHQVKIDAVKRIAENYRRKIDEMEAEATRSHVTAIGRLEELAKPFLVQEIAKENNKKSVQLVSGRAGYRHSEGLVVTDGAAAVAWAEAHKPELIKKVISVSATKKHIKNTGEVPVGVELEERENFYITPSVGLIEE